MFRVKQAVKMLLQNVFLPFIYRLYCRRPIERGLVLFADAHHSEMPFSMRRMYETVEGMMAAESDSRGSKETAPYDRAGVACSPSKKDAEIVLTSGIVPDGCRGKRRSDKERVGEMTLRVEHFVTDFDSLSFAALARYLIRFMRRYAVAEYVFICDYFLPVASCKKRPQTKVVQLWHSCGLMKQIAYDTGEDIPKGYRGSMFGNYSYLTLSSEACVPVHERALRLPREHIFATGVSRTDYYFDEAWNRRCRENFQRQHPEAAGKKIAVWAPTFRGNAAEPRLEGLEAVRQAAENLKDDWYLVIKAHPHVDRHGMVSNSAIPTEELLPVADVLITDYSSVLFDYLLYRKPAVLFAPDLEEYGQRRGFYIDYRSIPFPIVKTGAELEDELRILICQETQKDENGSTGKAAVREAAEAVDSSIVHEVAAEYKKGQHKVHWPAADWYEAHAQEIDAFRGNYAGACDGRSTERILQLIGLA